MHYIIAQIISETRFAYYDNKLMKGVNSTLHHAAISDKLRIRLNYLILILQDMVKLCGGIYGKWGLSEYRCKY